MIDSTGLTLIGIAVSIISGAFGMAFKRIGELDRRLRDAPDRDEVKDLINTKLEVVKVLQHEIKEDTKELKEKIDRICDKLDS